jgi:hypothetical protein
MYTEKTSELNLEAPNQISGGLKAQGDLNGALSKLEKRIENRETGSSWATFKSSWHQRPPK